MTDAQLQAIRERAKILRTLWQAAQDTPPDSRESFHLLHWCKTSGFPPVEDLRTLLEEVDRLRDIIRRAYDSDPDDLYEEGERLSGEANQQEGS